MEEKLLKLRAKHPLSTRELHRRVENYWVAETWQNCDLINPMLPMTSLLRLASIMVHKAGEMEDTPIWGPDQDEVLLVKKAYDVFEEVPEQST